mmetsp:Transcript_35587/g.52247  ORF Transcript_35587/g.52247 Transcript_35587/m.52247 type:complete len:89 (+) Transcript_35587:1015-1281(+)
MERCLKQPYACSFRTRAQKQVPLLSTKLPLQPTLEHSQTRLQEEEGVEKELVLEVVEEEEGSQRRWEWRKDDIVMAEAEEAATVAELP